eukprot:COSAG05_NODE_97_length_19444_cov_8.577174_11_plen_200_part_00
MQVLMQIVFGQEISGFVTDLKFLGIGFWYSFLYFCSFYMITVWVCVNLLIVTVLTNFDAANAKSSDKSITPDDMTGFAHTWAALTVGVHSVPLLADNHKNVLTALADKVHVADALDISTQGELRTFEDGDPALCGTLTVTVEAVHGNVEDLKDETVRPYAVIQANANDSITESEYITPEVRSRLRFPYYDPSFSPRFPD